VNTLTFTIDTFTTLNWLWDSQFFLDLEFTGLPGTYSATQTGEGWYAYGETAWVSTETPVLCGTSGYYGFYLWTYAPHDTGVVHDTLICNTYLIIRDNYILTAHYSPAHQVTV